MARARRDIAINPLRSSGGSAKPRKFTTWVWFPSCRPNLIKHVICSDICQVKNGDVIVGVDFDKPGIECAFVIELATDYPELHAVITDGDTFMWLEPIWIGPRRVRRIANKNADLSLIDRQIIKHCIEELLHDSE